MPLAFDACPNAAALSAAADAVEPTATEFGFAAELSKPAASD